MLGTAATDICLLRCLRPDSHGFTLLQMSAQNGIDPSICQRISRELVSVLNAITTATHQRLPPVNKISTLFYLAALLHDFPLPLEKAIVEKAFQNLTATLIPEEKSDNPPNLNACLSLLFTYFTPLQPPFSATSYLIAGLGMLAANKTFEGFTLEASNAFHRLLEQMIDPATEFTEDDMDDAVEVLVGLSRLAEQGILPVFTTKERSIIFLLRFLLFYIPQKKYDSPFSLKIILALGRLAGNQKAPQLPAETKQQLSTIVFATPSWDLPETYDANEYDKFADFIEALAGLMQSGLLLCCRGG